MDDHTYKPWFTYMNHLEPARVQETLNRPAALRAPGLPRARGMKIRQIRAFPLKRKAPPRKCDRGRDYWGADTEVAGPMSRYPRFKRHRALWRPTWPDIGCVAIAEDGTFGFATGRYGTPAAAIINDHLGPILYGESCFATEKAFDM